MNVEDRDSATRMRVKPPAPSVLEKGGSFQLKLIFVGVALVTVTWVGVLFYLGRELIARAFG